MKNIKEISFTITNKELYNIRMKTPFFKNLLWRLNEWKNNVNHFLYSELLNYSWEFYNITNTLCKK